MTWQIAYVLGLLVVGLVLFSRDVLPLDVVSLILLLLLVLPPANILTPGEALAGFGSETIVTLVGLFVLTAGVTRTGVVERLGLRIAGLARQHPVALTRMLLVGVTTISGFLSNTVTTAAMLPLAIGSARRASIPVAKVLMPLAFASILSGGVTLISTSTNLVVSGELPKYGMAPIGFFELAPVGIVITVLGMLYLLFVAPRLIPVRTAAGSAEALSLSGGTARAVRRIFEFDWWGPRTAAAKEAGRRAARAMRASMGLPNAAPAEPVARTPGGPQARVPADAAMAADTSAAGRPAASTRAGAADAGSSHGRDAATAVATLEDEPAAEEEAASAAGDTAVIERYGLRQYLTEVLVTPGSPLAGRTLGESRLGEALDLAVVGVRRGDRRILAPQPDMALHEGDVLLVEGGVEDVLAVKDAAGLEIKADFQLTDPDLQAEGVRMVEAMVLPRSELVGGTLRDVHFHETTGVTVLGIHARARGISFLGGSDRATRRIKLSSHRMEPGDMLLLQGSPANLDRLDGDDLMLLQDRSAHHPRSHKATAALLIFAGAVLLATTQVLPLSVALLTAIPVLVLTHCLTTEEAYESVDWRLMVLIAAMMAFGTAMTKTGSAGWLAGLIVAHVSGFGTYAVLIAFFLLTLLLTQPMSNQAAALVLLPVAIQTATTMGVDPRPMVMSVTFAASCSFLTPLEPSCVLVYGPGNYRFFDFVRVGGLLTLIVFAVSAALIPVFWPLVPMAAP